MIQEIKAALPDPEVLLALAPQELARVLLPIFKRHRGQVHLYNIMMHLKQGRVGEGYEAEYVPAVGIAITEAWNWLAVEGLIVPKPGDMGDWFIISRAGERIDGDEAFNDFAKAALLPRNLLHPKIAADAWANFLRGAHDLAVFAAFKQVEVAVREAAGCDARMTGTDLMRMAFHSDSGPLADRTLPKGEREALAHLFAGAIGSYKNPSSHRTVTIADASEAGEMLILASHLLRIVEDRARRRRGEGPPLHDDASPAASGMTKPV
ncbi:TIGR02391 family protein [Sediminicoccus sp. KRV36]|uniref:TIGR02391 family protein n=1 Tax=Sediminicoccus sp. KRV36 TaxID=3133721 RepID=UPI00200FDB4B|nr:TIGR02391 family protein [Sediminicoccus rosea]UPY38317.1 TIGR02391 family protein [Sediminicoccus rosea]